MIKAIPLSLAALGVSGLGIWGIHSHLKPKTVRAQMEWKGKSLWDNGEWEAVKTANEDTQKQEKIKAFIEKDEDPTTASDDGQVTTQKIQKACEKLLDKENSKENIDYANLYCFKEGDEKYFFNFFF